MDNENRTCLIASDEEDEDGNLSENEVSIGEDDEDGNLSEDEVSIGEDDEDGNLSEDEVSVGEDDEDYEQENLSDDTYEPSSAESALENDEEDEDGTLSEVNNKTNLSKSKKSDKGKVVYVSEDSSNLQPEDQNETMNHLKNDRNTHQKKPTLLSKSKQNVIITKNKSNKTMVPKKRTVSDKEDSDHWDSNFDGKENRSKLSNYKFARQPTPRTDAIMKDKMSNKNSKPAKEGSIESNSKNKKSPHPSQIDQVELNGQSEDLQTVNNEVDSKEESKADVTENDPLSFKKQEADLKLEIKEDIDLKNKVDMKMEGESIDIVDIHECQELLIENLNAIKDSKSMQNNIENKRENLKRKNEDNKPAYSSKKKKSTTNNVSKQQEKTCVPTTAFSMSHDTESAVLPTRRRGRPSKNQVLPLAARNKQSGKNLLTDVVNQTSSSLQPIKSAISGDADNAQPTSPKKKGTLAKNKGTESSKHCQEQSSPNSHVGKSAFNESSDVLTGETKSQSQLQQSVTIKLEYIPEPLLNRLFKTYVSATPTGSQENVFDNTDLTCLQQLDTPVVSSQTVQKTTNMTDKETNSFIGDYLISYQSVFDKSFFQSILPVLSEVLMQCMNEFTSLLLRNKKAESFTSEELRRQEVKLAMQSFCTMVSNYTEKFFPNFNSVMYKINQNKTKKGLIIALFFFIANSVWIKAPKFKGQIHTMRKVLMCMYQIRRIKSPLSLMVLTTPEKVFNDELRLLVKILIVLQKKCVLVIPTTVLPEFSSSDSVDEICESIMSLSTNCSNVSDPAFQMQDYQKTEETLDLILNLLKPNNEEKNAEVSHSSVVETGVNHCLTQYDVVRVLTESLEQDEASGLDSLFESYLKDGLKTEPDDGYAVLPCSSDMDTAIKVEEVDCASLLENADNYEQDPFL